MQEMRASVAACTVAVGYVLACVGCGLNVGVYAQLGSEARGVG
jgi:hypothetical protein